MKRLACFLLLALATAARGGADEWAWGDDGPSKPESAEDAFSPSRDPRILEADPLQGDSLAIGSLDLEGALSPEELRALEIILAAEGDTPSDPQASFAVSADGVDDLEVVDGVVLAGGDRQARFLGIRERLCSLGIGFSCEKNKAPSKVLKAPPNPPRRHISDQPYRRPPPPPPPAPYRPRPGFSHHQFPVTTEAPSAFQGIIDAIQPLLPTFGQDKTPKPKPFPLPHGKPITPSFGERFQNVPAQGSFHSKPSTNFAVYQNPKPIHSVPTAPIPLPTRPSPPVHKVAHVNHEAVQPTTVVEHHHKHTTIYQVNGASQSPPVYQGQAQTVHAVVTSQRDSSQQVHGAGTDLEQFVFGEDSSSDLAGSSSDVHFSGSKTQSQGVRFQSTANTQQGLVQGGVQTVQQGSAVRFGTRPQTVQQGSRVRFGSSTGTQQAQAQRVAQGSSVRVQHGAASSVQQNAGVRFGTQTGTQQVVSQANVQRIPQRVSTSVSVSSSVGTQGFPQVNNQAFQQAASQGHLQGHVQGQHHTFHSLDNMAQQHQVLTSVQEAVSANAIDPNFRPGKLEQGGFRPLSPSLYSEQAPAYREDCHCVHEDFCSDENVIARSLPEDFSQLLDARTKKTDILSTSEDAPKTAEESEDEVVVRTASSARRGKVLAFPPVTPEASGETTEASTEPTTEEVLEEATEVPEEVTEEMTEVTTDLPEEEEEEEIESATESRVRRESATNEEEESESDAPASPGRREGRQLTGFTAHGHGCGPKHVCCRRPVFKARPQYTCGRRNSAGLLGRVKTVEFVKGTAEYAEYPWQAAILKRKDGQVVYQCGGALIDDRHILTVAHCVKDIHPSEIKVRLGEWDVRSETEFYAHVEMRATGVYAHPEYNPGNLVNDLAVIRLESSVDFKTNPHITPVCLPDKFADFTHKRCHATGWGKDAFTSESKFSPLLKEVELPVMEYKQCEYSLQQARLGNAFSLHEGNICAGGEKDQDTCKGDGGGPLVCTGNDGSNQLAGLVSWGIGCGQPGVPGVYVKVSHYLEWIRAITRV